MRQNKWIYFFLCWFLGYLGIHRFYARKKYGWLWLFTFGLFGIGWIFDLIVAFFQLFSRSRKPSASGSFHPHRLPKNLPATVTIDDCKLAYSYNAVRFFPPVEMVSAAPKSAVSAGSRLTLVKEPSNEYDPHAVAVYSGTHQIGYLLRNRLQDMANDYLSNGWPIDSTLDSLTRNAGEYEGFLSLRFYRPK